MSEIKDLTTTRILGNKKYYNWRPIWNVWAKINQVKTFRNQIQIVSVFCFYKMTEQQLNDQHGWQQAYDRRAAHCKQCIDLELLDLVQLKRHRGVTDSRSKTNNWLGSSQC